MNLKTAISKLTLLYTSQVGRTGGIEIPRFNNKSTHLLEIKKLEIFGFENIYFHNTGLSDISYVLFIRMEGNSLIGNYDNLLKYVGYYNLSPRRIIKLIQAIKDTQNYLQLASL